MPDTPPPPPIPAELPVIPIRGTVVLPLTVAPLGVNRPMSVEAVNRALAGDRMVLLLLQESDADEPGPADLHKVGTVAIVRQMAKGPNGMRVLVEGIVRAQATAGRSRRSRKPASSMIAAKLNAPRISQTVVSIDAIPPREKSASIVSFPVVDTNPLAIAA